MIQIFLEILDSIRPFVSVCICILEGRTIIEEFEKNYIELLIEEFQMCIGT